MAHFRGVMRNTTSLSERVLLDAQELGSLLGMNKSQVWRLHRTGRIPVIRLGHRLHRYDLHAVREALKNLPSSGRAQDRQNVEVAR